MLSAGSCNTDEWREGNGGWRDGSGGCRHRGDSAEKSMGVRDNIEKVIGQRKDDHKLFAKEQEVKNVFVGTFVCVLKKIFCLSPQQFCCCYGLFNQ